jgi:hypothetical protein
VQRVNFMDAKTMECEFMPWFEARVAECGLTMGVDIELGTSGNDADADIAYFPYGGHKKVITGYGAGIAAATERLVRLFELLDAAA